MFTFPRSMPVADSPPWPLTLSGNKRHLIAISQNASQFHVFSLPGLVPVPIQRPKDHVTYHRSFGLSRDGARLLIGQFYQTEIVDLKKATSTELNLWPLTRFGIETGFTNTLPSEAVQLTADQRYLATQVPGDFTILYDSIEGKEVARTKEPAIPRLTADGKTLVCLSQQDWKTVQAIYELTEGGWVERAPWNAPYLSPHVEQFIQTCDDYLVTAWDEVYWGNVSHVNEDSWSHLPEMCKNLIKKVTTPGCAHLRFWDLGTGKPKQELDCALPLAWSDDFFRRLKSSMIICLRGDIKVSSDARFVAYEDEDRLSVWETNPRRPLLHYIILAACLGVALWLAWPRRVKVA
jgi:hypothetical protein